MNLNEKFMREIAKIKEPEIFVGVAKVLGVSFVEEKDVRDFVDVFGDVMKAYDARGRKFKRELLDILEKANRSEKDGSNTQNSETNLSE